MKTFCFCIPVRLGTFILSLMSTLSFALSTFAIFFQLRRLSNPPKSLLIPAIIYGGTTALWTILSLFGFIGTLLAKRSFVNAYRRSYIWALGLYIGMGVFYLIMLFTNKNEIQNDCIKALKNANNQNQESLCSDLVSTNRYIFLGIFIFQVLVSFWFYSIIAKYVEQLEESGYKNMGRNTRGGMSFYGNVGKSDGTGGPMPVYQPVTNPMASESKTGLVDDDDKYTDRDGAHYTVPYN